MSEKNFLVKQVINDDGESIPVSNQRWHWIVSLSGDPAMYCTGEFIVDSAGSGNGGLYRTKETTRGGITCERCLELIREIKAIKL